VRNRSELRLLAYPQPGCSQRLTRLKIAAADAAGSPYFHVRWSRRGAGGPRLKIDPVGCVATRPFHDRWSRRGAGGPGVKIAIFIARGWPARAMWDYLEKEWAVRGPGEGARSEPVLTTVSHSLALAQTLRSARRTEHFKGGPPGPIRQNVE